ncbi:hypothetical protein VEE32_36120 [Escherichia coli]|nr:hypothetical protein VEE32_36120 [Escherichia coli]
MKDISGLIPINIVFYSNREGKWGFNELKYKKGSDRRDAYSIENVSEYNVPGWLK